jgi:hypothetical protein
MRTTAPQPVTTPIPVQLSEPEFPALLLPHLAMPKRGPKCPRGESRVFTLIWWVLDTEMPWQCWPVPQAAHGHPAIHDTTVYPVLATWADDGALWPAFRARGRPLAAAPRHPRAPWRRAPPVAKPGARAWAPRATNISRGPKSSPALTSRARCERPSMRPTGGGCRRAGTR